MFLNKTFCVSVFLLLYAVAFSQTPLDSIQSLEEVTITANRYKEVIPAQTLKGEELEKLNSLSVADAIRYFSGVQIKDYGGVGGLKTVNIRSMGTNHTGVFYNGIQLGNAQNGQIDLGKFSLDNVEEIALYNGQKSEIFQSAKEFGSAGSIYLTTRKPKFEDRKNTNFKAGIRTGSFDLFNPSLLYEYKINDKISTTFNAEWINSSGKYPFRYRRVTPSGELAYDTTAIRQNGDIDASRMEGGLHGYLPNGLWKVQIYHYESERGVPGAIVNNVWRRGERLWDRNSFVQGAFQQEFTPKLSSKINLKYAFDYTRYVNNDDKLIHVDNIYKQREIYFSWANKYAVLPRWDVSMAYDFQWNDLSEFASVSRGTHWLSVATAFTIANRLKMQASALGTYVDEEAREREDISNKKELTPALFLSYQPFQKQGLVFRAFYKKSFRMPTFNDLYYTDMGNAYLRPEYADQYNVGILYDLKRRNKRFNYFHMGVDAYYNYVKDKIIAYPKGQQFRWTMLNLGKVDIRGVDVSAQVETLYFASLRITGKIQYTYQEAIDITHPADNYYRHQIPYIPLHSGSAIVMLTWKTWSMNYSFIYVGERYNQQENIRYNYTQPWYTSDVSLAKVLQMKNTVMKFSAEINNLLSQDYDVILNYPMPKRNFRFRISIEL
jgi:outer membrane cobalamin receptor